MNNYKNFPSDLQLQIEDAIVAGDLPIGGDFTLKEIDKRFQSKPQDSEIVLRSLERKGLVAFNDNQTIKILGLYEARIESVFQYAQKSKLKPETIVRSISVEPAELFIAEKLSIPVGDPVFVQVRTRMIDSQILANQYNFIPFDVCPGLEDVDLSRTSFQVTLEKRFHTVIARIEETYTLEQPKRDDAAILDIETDQSVLVVQRMSYSQTDFPLVYADIHVNPSQFHYVKDLWPKAQSLVESLQKGV